MSEEAFKEAKGDLAFSQQLRDATLAPEIAPIDPPMTEEPVEDVPLSP